MKNIDLLMNAGVGINPQYGKKNQVEHRRKVAKLGLGYEIRQKEGPGQNTFRRFSVSYHAARAKALEIESFINSTGGVESFLFTDPVDKRQYKVVCDQGAERNDEDDVVCTVNAEFREVP